ncbi:MAG: homocysteine S-methyltransferase family protein [Thermoleophilia bacterium]|nr:homocysteine S-methyltransferase family protein [Thermoleophilia bacterium]
MANRFLDALAQDRILVADGAIGTGLQRLGLGPGQPPEELVFDAPGAVLELHRSFVEAGAEIVLTNTFGGTPVRLRDSAYPGRAAELNRRAVELALEAAAPAGALVAGSMGPTGALLTSLPFGTLEPEEAREAYAEQAAALAEGGADLLLVETQFALDEALAAVEGARSASALPLVVSFSFDSVTKRGARTMMGVGAADLAETFPPLGVVALGANCGSTPVVSEAAIRELATLLPGLPLWAKPNAGLPKPLSNPPEYELRPEQLASSALRLVEAGARIVGGCCGTSPEHVRAIADAVSGLARA